jgi:hypothetical protein
MRLYLLILLLLVPAVCNSRSISAGPPFTDGAPIPLSTKELPKLFKQCSRPAPQPEEILGTPSSDEVSEMETKLYRHISEIYEAGKVGTPIRPPFVTYARQYVKFRVGDKQFIYGNFFPVSLAKEVRRKGYAVGVCDGGPVFWGAVYDLQSKQIEQLEFNGPM